MRFAWLVALAACGGATTKVAAPALPRGTQRITVDGGQIVVDVRGAAGRPVCIAHPGGPGLDSQYLHLPALEKRFTMVYIDPLGTGTSDKLPEAELYSLQRDVKVLEAVRVKLGLERVCLVGHSYGGFVVQQYAVEHPDRVMGLFLYSTSPTTEPDWQKQAEANTAWFKDQPWFAEAMKGIEDEPKATNETELAAAGTRVWPMYFADWEGHRAEYAPLVALLKISYEVHRRRPPDKNTRFDVRRRLGVIHTTPTVIVAGERDFICGVKPSTWIAQAIGGSKLVVIERAGHFAHIEQPGAFDNVVDTFAQLLR
jgi:proline iminopeptidase